MNNKQIIWRTIAGYNSLPHQKQWRSCVELSESKIKNYPKWVQKRFNSHDLQHGFMKKGIFYRPLYMVTIKKVDSLDGYIMPIAYYYERASQMLTDFNEHPEHKTITFGLMLAGFISYTRSEESKP